MSFSETIFLFLLALIIFGPKKLPEIARQAGRILAELRRASNEFKSQIETEIAHLELQKHETHGNQTVLPPAEPPPGTVGSLSLNPAAGESTESNPEPHALSAPVTETAPRAIPAVELDDSSPVVSEASNPASQASNV
jgi:sec-independent protein translocase protein TatB